MHWTWGCPFLQQPLRKIRWWYLTLWPSSSLNTPKRNMSTQNHVESFAMAPNCKQLKCSSTKDRINNLCYICTLEYCTAKKQNQTKPKILLHATTVLSLTERVKSQRSQREKSTYSVIFNIHEVQEQAQLICALRNQNSISLRHG